MPVRDTSIQVYLTKVLPNLSRRQAQVYFTFKQSLHDTLTDGELAKILHWPINCVTPRRGELERKGLIVDAVIAQSEAQRLQLWAMRDDVAQTFRYAPNYAFDVSLRISRMEGYLAEVNRRLDAAFDEVHNFIFGHMGDGNLHLVVSVGQGGPETRAKVEHCVYEPLGEVSGSVSAEHGVGLEKKPYLGISRSETEIGLMRTLKKALDPKGILNPGKIFDLQENESTSA